MSDEFQNKEDTTKQNPNNESSNFERIFSTKNNSSSLSSDLPNRAGALLARAYAKQKQKTEFPRSSASKLTFVFSKFILETLKEGNNSQRRKHSAALVDAVHLALSDRSIYKWETSHLEQVISALKGSSSDDKLISKIQSIVSAKETITMKPQRPNEDISSILPGIASRLPGTDDSGVARLLREVGPSCTQSASTFREVMNEFSRTTGHVNEASLAALLFFFSDKSGAADSSGSASLSSSLLGSLISGRPNDANAGSGAWNLKVVARVLNEDYSSRDWAAVARAMDFPSFYISGAQQFSTLVDLFRAGSGATPPLSEFTTAWHNAAGQLSVIESMMAVPPSVFMVPLDDEELADAETAPPPGPNSSPNPQCWACVSILQCLLRLSDNPSLRVRDLFLKCLLSCPEVLLCALVRLQLKTANLGAQQKGDLSANVGVRLKTDVMRELIPLFFRPDARQRVRNGPAAFRRLYSISPNTVTAACYEAWKTTATETTQVKLATVLHIINIARLLPSPADAVAALLNTSKDAEFSIAVAFVMADNDYLQLKPWLAEKMSGKTSVLTFAVALVGYLRKMRTWAVPRGNGPDGKGSPLVSVENVVVSLQLLQSLDASVLAQSVSSVDATMPTGSLGDVVKALVDAMASVYPALRSSFSNQTGGTSGRQHQPGPPATPDDVEEMATQYFQKIYTSEQSIGEVVEMLKRFKTSGRTKENEIFACMVHNLFDEYRFFSKYPQKELRITGILFGALIQEQLVSSITLGIALRYVLEALRKTPSPPGSTTMTGKMFNFGMFALEQFKGRLHEWPQYCSHIVQIPHLREGYADLVAEIEQEMTRRAPAEQSTNSQVGAHESSGLERAQSLPSASSLDAQQQPGAPARVAEFGPGLGRAVTDNDDAESEYEAPPDSVHDKVQLLVNMLAQANVEAKAQELKEMLDPRYFGWLGHFLVVRRISTQANYHSLYLSFLDNLGDYGKGLMDAIITSVYRNIGKLLRSSKITTSSSERSYLKNLGIWLGLITLARNRPILQIMLDAKELLLQGYETGKLIAVAPFLAKTLEGAKNSKVFRPPNPWLMGILGVFRSVYLVDGLKMNIKFEVEVLCKNLGIKLEDIPIRNDILGPRIAPVKERNPDFNIKSSSTGAKASTSAPAPSRSLGSGAGDVNVSLALPNVSSEERPSQDLDTLIPNLASYVTVNPSLQQLLQSSGSSVLGGVTNTMLKRWVPVAVDRAIREIITPVVDRSVTIACITTKEVVTKDFAMESDEAKVRKAGQLMVSNLAGSLALVTCREPLRSSVATHLRQLLSSNLGRNEKFSEQDQNVVEQCVQICATDNLELGCMLIEKATTEKAARDIEEALSSAVTTRRNHRDQTGQPYYDTSVFSSSNKYPAALPEQLHPKPGGMRVEHFQLYENFQRPTQQPQSQVAGVSRALSRTGPPETEAGQIQKPSQQFSSETLSALSSKLDSAISALLTAAGSRSSEVKLSMIPGDHQIRQILAAVKQILPNSGPSGPSRQLTASEQDLVLSFAQVIFKRLYELSLNEPLRLEALVALLENINVFCPKLGKDMGTWSTYAPTNTEQQRRLHRTVLLLLVRSKLLAVHDLDTFLAARADNGSNHIWLEFSLLFIRTAFMERIAASVDFPKLMDLMARVAEGRSQAKPAVAQSLRKPILQVLEETRVSAQEPIRSPQAGGPPAGGRRSAKATCLSVASLSTFVQAPKRIAESTQSFFAKDPAEAEPQVTSLVDAWLRLKTESEGDEKILAQYMQLLQRFGVGKVEERTEQFLRLATLTVIDAVLKNGEKVDNGPKKLNHTFIDNYASLLVILFRYMSAGGTSDQVNAQRLSVLNKILGTIVRCMIWHHEKSKASGESKWDQRPWFRLLMNLVIDLNKPDPAFEPIKLGILSVFGAAFHVCQPLVLPAFSFAWFELVSHRHFLPNLLSRKDTNGWNIAHELLIDQLLFLQPYLAHTELPQAVKKVYEGTLRVMLVVLHDFPSFLSCYHVSFCNVIPDNCVQLRNIVLSATPKGMNPPDPFTPNLKIDLLPEISQSPTIASNVLGPIAAFQGHLDAFLKDSNQRRNFLAGLPMILVGEDGSIDVAKVNSLIVYIGANALARMQSSQISLPHTPEIEVIQKLMELDDRNRYICLNAIANQLRFPSSHTHYFSCVILYLFGESKSVAVKEQVTRVLLERLIVHRPHPWGLHITFIELIKNQRYGFWSYPFTRCAAEIEKVFESVARSCLPPQHVGGEEH